MKNLILLTLLSLILAISMPTSAQQSTEPQTQTEQVQPAAPQEPTTVKTELAASQIQTAPPVEKVSFFKKLIDGIKGSGLTILISLICGILSKNGITKVIKAIAGKTTIVTKELSDVSLAVSNFSGLVDKAIKDDGSVDQNSISDAMAAGKTVIAETKEAWISIKPKPATVVPAV